MRELLMGNEAIAVGALAAGVQVVAGYPGTPSSEVLETIAKRNPGGVYVEWSVNEKAGAEVAAGAALSGARAMVTMKQMGLNVASDPIMCVNYLGVKGGLVIYVADDPGPISSQTEQDTRHFGKYARIPVFDCDCPEQAFQAVQDAFDFSEKNGTPVILRSTTRVCHACADINVPAITSTEPAEEFVKDSRWVIFPSLAYRRKQNLVRRESEFSDHFSAYQGNTIEGAGSIGIACGGISYAYVKEAIAGQEALFTVLKIATPYPFPTALADRFLSQVDQVIAFEELDPVIEDALIYRLGSRQSLDSMKILGKRSETVPAAGELSAETVSAIISRETGIPLHLSPAPASSGDDVCNQSGAPGIKANEASRAPGTNVSDAGASVSDAAPHMPDLPVRPPVLCAGCPHRGSFYAVKKAVTQLMRQANQTASTPPFTQAIYHGDIGCYTLGNAAPLNMVDTCLCMGAGISMAQGMNHANSGALNFAFVGDSTFFASGITGTVNAVYNQAEMILCILDNSTTAMTGHQPHPGMGITMMGERVTPIDIQKVLEGIGVPWIRTVNPLDHQACVDTVTEAIGQRGVRAIIFKSPCIALFKPERVCRVQADQCIGCLRCIQEIGCSALTPAATDTVASDTASADTGTSDTAASGGTAGRRKVNINPALCNGCSLCAQICPTGCIKVMPLHKAGDGGSGTRDTEPDQKETEATE